MEKAQRFLTTAELARRWRMSAATLRNWRSIGRGPQHFTTGAIVRYPIARVVEFERAHTYPRQREI